MCARMGPLRPIKGTQEQRFLNAVTVAVEVGAVMTERDQLAYDLYSAAISIGHYSPDARLACS